MNFIELVPTRFVATIARKTVWIDETQDEALVFNAFDIASREKPIRLSPPANGHQYFTGAVFSYEVS
jgi:hypothetical protein